VLGMESVLSRMFRKLTRVNHKLILVKAFSLNEFLIDKKLLLLPSAAADASVAEKLYFPVKPIFLIKMYSGKLIFVLHTQIEK
jgi:hypothetical protein